MSSLIGFIAFLAVPAYPVLQVLALKRLDGGWWYAALVPLVLMIPIVVVTVLAFLDRSNLWPLFLVLAAPVALLYLMLTMMLHRMTRQ